VRARGVRRPRLRHPGRDDGAAAVEFALVVPLLVMLVFGIIGFGIAFAQKLALSNSARESARLGVVGLQATQRATCQDLANQVQGSVSTISLNPAQVRIWVYRKDNPASSGNGTLRCSGTGATISNPSTRPCTSGDEDSQLLVRLEYDSELVIPLSVVVPTLTLDGRGVYRCEYR